MRCPTVLAVLALSACAPSSDRPGGPVGTAAQRSELFDRIREATARREAFSPPKNERLGLDVLAEMDALRPEVVGARTEEDLFYALVQLSAARRDRHLEVEPVPGGLAVPGFEAEAQAPLDFAADYGTPGVYEVFVSDLDPAFFPDRVPAIGDRVVAVDGVPIDDWQRDVARFYRWSTVENLWSHVADELNERGGLVPPDRYGPTVTYELRAADGATYAVELPWLAPEEIAWAGPQEPVYPDFELVWVTDTYALYRHVGGRDVVLLRWFGFEDTLVEDVDRLMAYAQDEGLLGHALVVDATGSGGGSRGVYALQRMLGRPFRPTLGNLRLSDVVPAFVDQTRAEVKAGEVTDGDDGGARLLAWLEGPVLDELDAGDAYTEDVPFKMAYVPEEDGTLAPADLHFTGPLVCLFGPSGGSHLDQFAAMVADDELAHTIGLPTGGYSNTWEWTEVLTLPGTRRPLASFMWSIGQTIRPDGEVLEGNPAPIDERVPPTAENWPRYTELLLERAYAWLDARTAP